MPKCQFCCCRYSHVTFVSPQVPPVVLEWDRLSCSFTPKGKAGGHKTDSSSGTKVILQQLSGCAKPGRWELNRQQ